MTRICCDTDTDEAAWVLCGLLPCVSGLIKPATELSIHLDTSASCTVAVSHMFHHLLCVLKLMPSVILIIQ